MNGNPRWILTCDKCGSEFPHSDVVDRLASQRDPSTGYVHKPEFPGNGLSTECPHCRSLPFINVTNLSIDRRKLWILPGLAGAQIFKLLQLTWRHAHF
jgi:hypothetical protein